MSDAQITKKALAQALKTLMRDLPLAKVSVQGIVDACGLQRQTFYYHFSDKFELVNWIYRTEALESIADCRDYGHWTEGIRRIFAYLLDNRAFYMNVLDAPGPKRFDEYLFQATRELNLGVLREVSGGHRVKAADQGFIADFYTHAFVGIALRWIRGGMRESPESLSAKIQAIVEGSMQRASAKLAQPLRSGALLRRPGAD